MIRTTEYIRLWLATHFNDLGYYKRCCSQYLLLYYVTAFRTICWLVIHTYYPCSRHLVEVFVNTQGKVNNYFFFGIVQP